LDEILYGEDNVECDPNYVLFNPVGITISKWWTFKLMRWVLLLNRLVDLDEILYGDNDVEADLDSISDDPVASTIPKLPTFKLL
jgi:hypothetical protein